MAAVADFVVVVRLGFLTLLLALALMNVAWINYVAAGGTDTDGYPIGGLKPGTSVFKQSGSLESDPVSMAIPVVAWLVLAAVVLLSRLVRFFFKLILDTPNGLRRRESTATSPASASRPLRTEVQNSIEETRDWLRQMRENGEPRYRRMLEALSNLRILAAAWIVMRRRNRRRRKAGNRWPDY